MNLLYGEAKLIAEAHNYMHVLGQNICLIPKLMQNVAGIHCCNKRHMITM